MDRYALTILTSCCLALPAPGALAGEPASARTSSWQTHVTIDAPLPQLATRRVTTGALPPETPAKPARPVTVHGHDLEGLASFYWQGQRTASGETFDRMAMTAAHRTLPFGSRVRVTSLANGRSVVVRINDRGPFKPGRVIDLSWAAAGEIDMRAKGLTKVKVEVLELGPEKARARAAGR